MDNEEDDGEPALEDCLSEVSEDPRVCEGDDDYRQCPAAAMSPEDEEPCLEALNERNESDSRGKEGSLRHAHLDARLSMIRLCSARP